MSHLGNSPASNKLLCTYFNSAYILDITARLASLHFIIVLCGHDVKKFISLNLRVVHKCREDVTKGIVSNTYLNYIVTQDFSAPLTM